MKFVTSYNQDYLTLHLLKYPVPVSMKTAIPSLTSLRCTQDRVCCACIA